MERQLQNKTPLQRPQTGDTKNQSHSVEVPSITLPKGGGAIKGIDEKFQVNAITGTSAFSIPIPFSPSRNGFIPNVGLNYNSGAGNSPFGLGWQLTMPSISRNTQKRLPQYKDEEESDTFMLSGSEDLVPLLEKQPDSSWKRFERSMTEGGITYTVKRYRPRIEGLFARIEKWQNTGSGETHWRTITKNNIHSYYGLTAESRIADSSDPSHVFEWLLCKTHDDKGNLLLNYFKKEDFANLDQKLYEKNRIGNCTQTYLKKMVYGNKNPYYLGDDLPAESDFMFKVLFDYGEHDLTMPVPKDVDIEKKEWDCRKDPFSTYRSGFEIRTYRRCNRVLIFHCFEANELPHSPYLTKSLQLFYEDELKGGSRDNSITGFSFLVKARQNGHLWDARASSYKTKYLPEIELRYQQHEWNTEVKNVSIEDRVHAPVGIDDKTYLWVDLFSEGLSGILTEQAEGWFYKSNLGDGHFSNALPVASKPSFNGMSSGKLSIQELQGDGVKYLVQYGNEPKGFFKLTDEEKWEPMRNFEAFPNIHPLDPDLRSIDLNGDGLADLLLTEDDKFRWYPGAGERGFDISQSVYKDIDEEKGPAIVFSDKGQSIFLADMSGDGLTDILRIRNGDICYWPNLGYGRFGTKVSMDHAPWFDHPDSFNPAFLRLADIDGSGTTDVVYLGKNNFSVWLNLNGNEWSSEPQVISAFPEIDNLSDIAVLDFLGTGTACIVYSSPISNQPLKYVNLMGSKKPGLFCGYINNCGKEVTLEYKPSTYFYLKDKLEGNKWITKLPFPVHCISKVKSEDRVRQTVFSSSYSYRHGYFDHKEREYRGFARVEQLDTEDFEQFKLNDAKNVVEADLHQPPVRTVTWYHTGAFLRNKKIFHQCETEYFQNTEFSEYQIPEALTPTGLSVDELREACRACKGVPLRSEVYAEDGNDKSAFPYAASQSTIEIRLIQPKDKNRYASFLVLPTESVSYTYDRNPADPRISQSFVLETDELGNIQKSASIVYPRVARPMVHNAIPDKVWEEQNKMHISYGEALFTNDKIDEANQIYRLRVGYESKTFEIHGIHQPADFFFKREDLKTKIAATAQILFEEDFDGSPQKRLSAHSRGYFYKDDLTGPLPLGELSALGIPHKSYQLAFTKGLVAKYYNRGAARVTDSMLRDAKYVHSEGDEHWWTQPGEPIFPANPKDTFYTPVGGRDVFGNESFVEFDPYVFLAVKTTDAIGNFSTAQNDYRTLSPVLLTDSNMNREAVETDELGLVIKSAVMGKEGAGEGDTLADPTARMEYDLFNWQNNGKPNYVHTYAREQHGAANPRWQENYVYSDGGGDVIMTKRQAKPGKAKQWNTVTQKIDEVDADPRWVGNGRTIVNNKGNPVKKYEPYFSTTFEYESEAALVETGITPVLYYDPIGRNYRTELPNGTFSKVEFDPWYSKSYDVNDTVRNSQWYVDRGSPDPLGPEPVDPETRAAWLAAKHDNTPGTAFVDSLGKTTYAVTDYGNGKTTFTYSETEPVGRYSKVFDPLGRKVSEGAINLLGQTIYGKTAEKGERWIFTDVMGRLVKIWDNDICEMYSTFDKLHRPISTYVKKDATEILFAHIIYGDLFPDAEALAKNMKGRAYKMYDQAGAVTIRKVDFKGNATEVERRLTKEYKQSINWKPLEGLNDIPSIQAAAEPILESEIFSSSVVLDALNRPVTATLPDHSVVQPNYNEANLLDSLQVKIRGAGNFVTFLDSQDYDAKGQRQYAKYGNGTITQYFYDPQTFRLTNLVTRAPSGDGKLQDLKYHFDPVGNITQIRDDARQTYFFKNTVVYPENKYEYDAVYRLKLATGREHAGLGANIQRNDLDIPVISPLPHENDAAAIRNYKEQYEYDDCGNIKQFKHIATNANWTRRYQYAYEVDPGNNTNRLKATSLPGDAEEVFSASYQHDLHGNMTAMPHLSAPDSMQWNFMDQLKEVNLGGGGAAYYVYGLGGNRIRKMIERMGGKKRERIYLGSVEIYREYQGDVKKLERSTLHISDDTGRIAQVDTKLLDVDHTDANNPLNENLIRYQYGNHLGSATLEVDEKGKVLSYEEYHPYGTSAYRSSKSDVDLSLKRYRFSGKERDDETGFYYFGARYYAAWLGRWTSTDPAGFVDGLNLFRYCSNNPIIKKDGFGLSGYTIPDKPENIRRAQMDVSEETGAASGETYESWVRAQILEIDNKFYEIKGGTLTSEGGYWHIENVSFIKVPVIEVTAGPPANNSSTSSPSDHTPHPRSHEAHRNPPSSPETNETQTHGNVLSAAATNDSFQRGRYERSDRVGSRAAQEAIEQARQEGNAAAAMEEARTVSAARNAGRTATQGQLTPHGAALSRALEQPRDFGRMVDTYSNRLPSVEAKKLPSLVAEALGPTSDEFEVARRIAVAAGESRPIMRNLGRTGRILGPIGVGVSVFALGNDIYNADYSMAVGDSLTVIGSGMELYGLAASGGGSGATIAGVSALPLGLVIGGVGLSVTSGISAYRAYQRGDVGGTIAGVVGVGAGAAIATGGAMALASAAGVAMAPALVAAAPILIAAGAVAAIGVGIYHLGKYFDWW